MTPEQKKNHVLKAWKRLPYPDFTEPDMKQAHERLEICAKCEFFTGEVCRKCNCLMILKLRSSQASCPIDNW